MGVSFLFLGAPTDVNTLLHLDSPLNNQSKRANQCDHDIQDAWIPTYKPSNRPICINLRRGLVWKYNFLTDTELVKGFFSS